MVKEAELADNWIACFYNRAQAMKAYKMMEQLSGKNINGLKKRKAG